jgi:hypothetical protein
MYFKVFCFLEASGFVLGSTRDWVSYNLLKID